MTRGTDEKIVFRCTSSDDLPVLLVGDISELGAWHVERAVAMQRSGGGMRTEWSAALELPLGQTIEFKFVKKTQQGIVWEAGNNRRYTVISGSHTLADSFRT